MTHSTEQATPSRESRLREAIREAIDATNTPSYFNVLPKWNEARNELTSRILAAVLPLLHEGVEDYHDSLSVDQWLRLRDWMKDVNRKSSSLAFTAGILRDAASAFESAAHLAARQAAKD